MAYGTTEWADKMGLLKEEKPAQNETKKKEEQSEPQQ